MKKKIIKQKFKHRLPSQSRSRQQSSSSSISSYQSESYSSSSYVSNSSSNSQSKKGRKRRNYTRRVTKYRRHTRQQRRILRSCSPNSKQQSSMSESHQKVRMFNKSQVAQLEEQIIELPNIVNQNQDENLFLDNVDITLTPFQNKICLEKHYHKLFLASLEFQLKSRKEAKQSSNYYRPPIDLVFVVDISESMRGQKIQLVKDSIRYIMKVLSNRDRISIVSFQSSSYFILPWTLNSQENKEKIKKKIKSLSAYGGTNITSGVDKGLHLIKMRKWKNPVTLMFLLSDGQEDNTKEKIQKLLRKYQISDTFLINTFGFGEDHDAKEMNDIANLKSGTFYYIEDMKKLANLFILSMAGMFSILAKDLSINIKLLKNQEEFKIEKIYGENIIWHKQQDSWQANLNYFYKEKKYLFEILLPKQRNDRNLEYEEENVKILECIVEGHNISNVSKFRKSIILEIQLVNDKIQSEKLNESQIILFYRCKAGEIIGLVSQLTKQKKNNESKQLLENFIREIQNLEFLNNEKLEKTLIKMKKAYDLCSEQNINQAFLYKTQNNQLNQDESSDDISNWNEDQNSIMSDFKKGNYSLSRSQSKDENENSMSDSQDFSLRSRSR